MPKQEYIKQNLITFGYYAIKVIKIAVVLLVAFVAYRCAKYVADEYVAANSGPTAAELAERAEQEEIRQHEQRMALILYQAERWNRQVEHEKQRDAERLENERQHWLQEGREAEQRIQELNRRREQEAAWLEQQERDRAEREQMARVARAEREARELELSKIKFDGFRPIDNHYRNMFGDNFQPATNTPPPPTPLYKQSFAGGFPNRPFGGK